MHAEREYDLSTKTAIAWAQLWRAWPPATSAETTRRQSSLLRRLPGARESTYFDKKLISSNNRWDNNPCTDRNNKIMNATIDPLLNIETWLSELDLTASSVDSWPPPGFSRIRCGHEWNFFFRRLGHSAICCSIFSVPSLAPQNADPLPWRGRKWWRLRWWLRWPLVLQSIPSNLKVCTIHHDTTSLISPHLPCYFLITPHSVSYRAVHSVKPFSSPTVHCHFWCDNQFKLLAPTAPDLINYPAYRRLAVSVIAKCNQTFHVFWLPNAVG